MISSRDEAKAQAETASAVDAAMDRSDAEATRRDFLKAIAAGAVALAPGLTLMAVGGAGDAAAKPAGEAVTAKNRWGILIDAAKFTPADVDKCVKACQDTNGWHSTGHPLVDPQWIRRVDLTNRRTKQSFTLPMMCQHCAEPPCVDVCPTGASFKRADGIVLVDKHICIGCRYCMMACPYKARSFEHQEVHDQVPVAPRGMGTVESCTLCVDRVDAGQLPACVEAAPAGGMVFGDLNDPASEISKLMNTVVTQQLRADMNLDTGIRYRNI